MPTQGLAGQHVALVPLTLVVADPLLQSDTLYAGYRDRRATLTWADSLIGEAFVGRAPEVKWVLPPALRKIARRVARASWAIPTRWARRCCGRPSCKDVPDPLRASLRNLMAVVGGRVAMVPAALSFSRDTAGARARRALARGRRHPDAARSSGGARRRGTGATPDAALAAALDGGAPLLE